MALATLGIAGSLVEIAQQGKEHYVEHRRTALRALMLKRVLLILIAILCALLLLVGVVKGMASLHILSINTVTSLAGSAPPADENGYTNLLLLGQGDAEHDGKDLTDTVMVASIDPKDTKSVVLLSLPRDLYFLHTEKMGKGRINSMYRDYKGFLRFQKGMEENDASTEALSELGAEVGRSLGMEIHGIVKVDFEGFVEAVDTIGGVEVDVPYEIVDTEYPNESYGYETFELHKGLRQLDGATALKYARSRHTTSDFGRAARQQQLLASMGEKARADGLVKDPKKIMSLIRILKEHLESTFSASELVGLADIAQDIDQSRIITMQLNDRNALYDGFIEPGGFLYAPLRNQFEGASVLLPVSIPEFPVTWKQIDALTDLLIENRSAHLANPTFSVLNSSARPGSARRLANELIRYGFTVETIANASSDDQATSTISYRAEEDNSLAEFFGLLLGLEVVLLPESLPADEVEQLTIILGDDYKYSPLQNLVPALK